MAKRCAVITVKPSFFNWGSNIRRKLKDAGFEEYSALSMIPSGPESDTFILLGELDEKSVDALKKIKGVVEIEVDDQEIDVYV